MECHVFSTPLISSHPVNAPLISGELPPPLEPVVVCGIPEQQARTTTPTPTLNGVVQVADVATASLSLPIRGSLPGVGLPHPISGCVHDPLEVARDLGVDTLLDMARQHDKNRQAACSAASGQNEHPLFFVVNSLSLHVKNGRLKLKTYN